MKLLAITLSLIAMTAQAATTGTLLLKGTVPEMMSITVVPETIAVALPLDITQVDTKVATVTEASNSNTGYKVTITSSNLGNLARTGGSELFPYTMKYGGQSVNLASSQVFTNSTISAVNVSKDVQVSYTGVPASNMVAGEYTDTVTFTIEAN